jgi:hypothetical protein
MPADPEFPQTFLAVQTDVDRPGRDGAGADRRDARPPSARFLKGGTQKCVSDASAVWANDSTPKVLLDG